MSAEPRVILLVDDSPTQLGQMQLLLEHEGYKSLSAPTAEDALEIAGQQPIDLVVTDLEMPGMSGLDLVMMLKMQHPNLPVILTTARGSEELAVKSLEQGAASYVPKRNISDDLVETIQRTLSVADTEQERLLFSQYVDRITIELKLENDDKLLPQILARVEQPLLELGIVDQATSMHIGVALDEALRNAMIHGNLEVSSDLREQENGQAYLDMIQARLQDPEYAARRVHVRLDADHDEATIIITDEGPGYDVGQQPDPTNPDNWEEVSGRGLLLIRSFMDEVHHNETGNQITMIKRKVDPNAIDDDDD